MVKDIYQYQLIRKLVEDGIQESVAKKAVELLFNHLKDATQNGMHHRIKFHGVGRLEVSGRPKKTITGSRVLLKQIKEI